MDLGVPALTAAAEAPTPPGNGRAAVPPPSPLPDPPAPLEPGEQPTPVRLFSPSGEVTGPPPQPPAADVGESPPPPVACPAPCLCDLDKDGSVSSKDVDQMVERVFNPNSDGSRRANVVDVVIVINALLGKGCRIDP